MKHYLRDIAHHNRTFWIPLVFLWLAGILVMMIHPKGWLVLQLNALHHPFLDTVFAFSTRGGEEWAGIAVGVFLIIARERKYLVAYLLSLLSMIACVQLLKHGVFEDAMRPLAWFGEDVPNLHKVEGVKIHLKNSFPSGHTSAGFFFFSFWAMCVPQQFWKVFFLFSAVLVALSRVYLLQHFLEDIFFGSLLGCSFAVAGMLLARSMFPSTPYWNRKWTRTSNT